MPRGCHCRRAELGGRVLCGQGLHGEGAAAGGLAAGLPWSQLPRNCGGREAWMRLGRKWARGEPITCLGMAMPLPCPSTDGRSSLFHNFPQRTSLTHPHWVLGWVGVQGMGAELWSRWMRTREHGHLEALGIMRPWGAQSSWRPASRLQGRNSPPV